MKSRVSAYFGGAVLAAIVAWQPAANAQSTSTRQPVFAVDPSWPQPLPAPVGSDGLAHAWVQGEVAGNCTDSRDNIYTFNRGWEVGATVNGVLQGNESGAINGNDATSGGAIPSPPVVAFDSDGNTIAGWGNPSLFPATDVDGGYASYMPQGAHGCYIDYQGYIWVGGNGDGIVQKYNPMAANAEGANATYLFQIGTKGMCDTTTPPASGANPFTSCGETTDANSSHTLLNEPPDIAVDPLPDPITGTPGSVYIADGYGNHRIVVYTTADGGQTYTYNRQWGTTCMINGVPSDSQACPAEAFGATGGGHPHCVVLGNDRNVYVCDRPDSRILVFSRSCGAPSVNGSQPLCTPLKIINIGLNAGQTPPTNTTVVGNNAFQNAAPPDAAAILGSTETRADWLDFWPNIDYLATRSPTSPKVLIDVDLDNDNTWLMDNVTYTVFGALGVCGIIPCPGHNAGHFAYNHSVSVDSKGNVYVAETITGRRIQKFVQVK
jgi:NHL repeat